MKNFLRKPVSMAGVVLGAMAFACMPQDQNPVIDDSVVEYVKFQHGDIIPGKYIVRLNPTNLNFRKTKDYASNQAAMRKISMGILARYDIQEASLGYVYGSSIEGFSVELSSEEFEKLSKDPAVKFIEPDRIMALAPPPGKGPGDGGGSDPAQETPWGITRVGGGQVYTGDAKAYVIDSGIDAAHPDLNVNSAIGFNAFTDKRDGDITKDGSGHGTHVAGTIAAIDNEIGVVGVAAGATVVPVKVLNSRGSGSYSGVIAGVDFVTATASNGDVANMSLGGPLSQALNDAVIALGASGVKVALAAGNESTDANTKSPASANGPNIYTISATDINDRFASFSNFGNPPVDFAAPGVGVLSTVPGGGYASYNGTSMASPHVAGILLTGNPRSGGNATNDPDGNADQIAVK
ncbi:S8 family serine peptidase [Algoriphagus limi]|uniref:S8 family serine peptidase n=1 Tax=Algoriphagus limi TaxID=2975273 RepID=A0ABT2G4U6_9BACT|nr:S8 family serine peptidase [Algoriphagus limi]MCS5490284.1 S8 family serine peptidase [Algoriphagus limi]